MRIARLLAAALAAAILAVLSSAPALAHNSLTGAKPAKNATLDEAPDGVELTFLQRVDPGALSITVTDAAKRTVPAGAPEADGKTAAVTFGDPLGNGVYTVTYRVVSLDGHPVQGSYRFTVDSPSAAPSTVVSSAPAPASGPAVAPAAAVPAASTTSDDSAWWPWALGIVLVALLGAGAVLVARRRRTT